ncbi:MAG TPA: glycine cleavage system aminomethyltransferase GcvT [Caldisericia bacterium]|nr:glycine cleavage system aminomethyltransferase GcvT [Caldisericia bacterium]
MTNLKKTPLYDEHVKLGATIVPFAGFEMPLNFSSIIDEHLAVRDCAGIFDVSHMGEIEIVGLDAIKFSDYLCTNRITDMNNGDIKYTIMCYEDGGEVDDLLAYRINDEKVLLVVNASNIDKDFEHILEIKKLRSDLKVEVSNLSDNYGQVAFQGPMAEEILQKLTDYQLENIKVFKFQNISILGIDTVTSRTGYTGEDGFEILTKPEDTPKIWNGILNAGKNFGVKPCGLGARDTLRFEACLWLYGNDIDETTNPLEAGQTFAVKLDKDFVGRDKLLKIKEEGIKRTLAGFFISDNLIPRHGMDILKNGEKVGYVTSGSFCPKIKKIAALGYIPTELNNIGETFVIPIRGKEEIATLVSKPFYKGTSGRKDRR